MITFSMEVLSKVRETLAANNIDCTIKTINRNSPSPASRGTRATMGTFGQDQNLSYEYIVYVKKSDYDKAELFTR